MCGMAISAARVAADLVDVSRADLPLAELGDAVSTALSRLAPHEGFCLIGFDPVSGLRTLQTARNALYDDEARLARNELVEQDLNRFADLARCAVPVGVLGGRGERERHSIRLHEILPDHGFGGELRLVANSGGIIWGAMVLIREHGRPAFTDEEIAGVARTAEPIGLGLRRVPVRAASHRPAAERAAGVLLVSSQDTVDSISAEAYAWLQDMPTPVVLDVGDQLPRILIELAYAARRSQSPPVGKFLTRIRCRSGSWLSVSANKLDDHGRVAVLLTPATPTQLVPALAAWYRLTPREHDVLDLAIDGYPRKQIARRLQLSTYTVTGHLEQIYRKTNTTCRDDLLASLR
jgi:DNA-binding CsgD family transcriptional regulator